MLPISPLNSDFFAAIVLCYLNTHIYEECNKLFIVLCFYVFISELVSLSNVENMKSKATS